VYFDLFTAFAPLNKKAKSKITLVLTCTHLLEGGHIHAAKIDAPLVKGVGTDTHLLGDLRYRYTSLNPFQGFLDMVSGEFRLLHVELLVTGKFNFKLPLNGGRITYQSKQGAKTN
jgi:hypothetical protein